MSKAFVKDDAGAEAPTEVDPADLVPPGAVNYLTTGALERFTRELADLNAGAVRDEATERRRRYLTRLLEISRPLDPVAQSGAQARFGATVAVRGEDGAVRRFVIVGIHEADAARGRVSWNSPLGRALLGAAAGDVRTLNGPRGAEELEILSVTYVHIDP